MGTNTWIRIILVSALVLMVLEPVAIATGSRQENTPIGVTGMGALRQADLPNVEIGQVASVPAADGGITGEPVSPEERALTIASGPSVSGVFIFPGDHIWNTRIDSLPVDSRSSDYISAIGSTAYLHADFGSGLWEGTPIGIPYTIVNGSQQKKTVVFDYADESDSVPYPIPDNPLIEGGSDHHMVIIDRDAKILYELFAAEKMPDGSWTAGSGAVFDLSDYTLRPSGWTSADAAGLAILPGLVRYDEVSAGEITHAIRFTAPSTRKAYVWPARHYASSITDPAYPPMGQRFRLKSSFDTSGYSSQAQIVLNALKKYGMILSDNGAPWYISGAPDERWNNDVLHTLHQLRGSDFEAVDTSSLMISPDSGKARINPAVIPPSRLIGVFRPSSHTFLLKNGTTTMSVNWGISTDLPVTGDWNADGSTDVGVYRPSTHMFYLRNGTTTAVNWGISTDLPVTGDWNADGSTDVGVYRPSTHMFYLRNGTTTAINWGISTDLPVTGDWNADGSTDVGVYRPSTHMFYLRNGTTTAVNWGVSTDLPVTGDWNADGSTDVGVYRPSTHTFYLRNGTTTAINWGISTDLPVTGKW
jgi:hypothetical protein